MKTLKPILTVLAGCCFAIAFACNTLYATTNVPKGGADIPVGPGGNSQQVKVKNTTGKTATDITITIYKDDNSAVPNIQSIDIANAADTFDDNDNGIKDPAETDNTDSSPGTTGRAITPSGTSDIKDGETATVNIGFTGNLPPGAKLKVRFSTKDNSNKHYDMCATSQLRGVGNTYNINIPKGTHTVYTEALNITVNNITGFMLQIPPTAGINFNSILIASPFQASVVNIAGNQANIIPNPSLEPFQQMELYIQLNTAPTAATGANVVVVTMGQETRPNCIFPVITGAVGRPSAWPPFFDVFTTVAFNPAPMNCKDFTFTNSTGQAASDFHAIFAGTGGSLETAVVTAPAGCGEPKIPSNGKVGNRSEIEWPSACIPAGSTITIRVCTQNGPLAFAGGHWTNKGKNIGNINISDVTDTGNDQGIPGNSYFVQTGDNTLTFLPDGSGLQTIQQSNILIPEIPFDVSVSASGGGFPCAFTLPNNPMFNAVPCSDIAGTPFPLAEYPRIAVLVNQPVIFTNGANPVTDINITPPVMLNPIQNYLCGTDYQVVNNLGNWAAIFERQGNMGVEITYTNGLTERYIVEVGTNSTNAGETEGACLGGTSTEVDCGAPDVVVVSGSLGFPHAWGEVGEECGDVHEAAEAICAAYEANGNQPISVTVDAHGSSGSIEIGGENLTIDNIADFADAVAGKISQLNVFACSVAEGADGIAFICALEEALGCNVIASTGVMSDLGEDPNQWFTEGEMVSWEPPSNPIIYSVSPSVAAPGELVQVHGTGFDYLQPGCLLYLTGAFNVIYNGPFHTWQNNLIIFEMPCSPDPLPVEIVPLQLQAIRPGGFGSNQISIDYQTPQDAWFVAPRSGQHITNQPIQLQAVPEGVRTNYIQAGFYYRNAPSSPWIFIGADTDGTAPGMGTEVPIGSGNGWSVLWDPGSQPFDGTWIDLRVVFTDACGGTVEDIIPVFIDPTPLAPVIDYNLSKLTGNRLFEDDFINLHFFVADENATGVTIDWTPLHWNWTRALEAMGQQGSGIEDKEGDDASDMACGPVSAASCLRYYKDQFADIDSVAIDSLAQLIACHAGTDDETGTTVDGLLKGMGETLKGLGVNTDDWKAEWHDAAGNEKTIMADMIKCLTKDSADVIPLFYQNANKDINGDGVINHDETDTIPDDRWGHFVTLSSHHTGIRDYIIPPIPPGQHIMGTVEFIDFMDPWTGATEDYEIDNTTTPPELKGNLPFVVDTCAQGNTYLRGFVKVKPPAAGGGSNEQRLASAASGLPSSANAMLSSLTIPLSGPGNYVVSIPSNQFELGTSIATLTAYDANGHEESTNVLLYAGGCNNADFYHYQTTTPLTVQFTDVSAYNLPPASWEWDFNGDNIADATGQNPVFTFPATGSYIVRMYVTTGTCTDAAAHLVTVSATPPPRLYGALLLEGATTGTGQMTTNLLAAGLLPKMQPYNRAPWNYTGNEGVTALPANTTDWVLAELRSAASPATIVASKAGFVRNDGVLVDVDGSTGLSFEGVNAAQNYYVVMRHRNHLAVISSATVMLNNSASPYDFSLAPAQVQGTNQLKPVGGGQYALCAGDFNSDGVITYADFNYYFAESSALNQYVDSDCNLDGNTTIDDFNLYMPNASKIGVALVRY